MARRRESIMRLVEMVGQGDPRPELVVARKYLTPD